MIGDSFLDFGTLQCAECRWRLLFARRDFLSEVGEPAGGSSGPRARKWPGHSRARRRGLHSIRKMPALAMLDQPFLLNFEALINAAFAPGSELRAVIDKTLLDTMGVRVPGPVARASGSGSGSGSELPVLTVHR